LDFLKHHRGAFEYYPDVPEWSIFRWPVWWHRTHCYRAFVRQ